MTLNINQSINQSTCYALSKVVKFPTNKNILKRYIYSTYRFETEISVIQRDFHLIKKAA